MKICSTCKIEKDFSCFTKKTREKDGLDGQCKSCRKIAYLKYYEKNKERIKKVNKFYKEKNPEKAKLAQKNSFLKKIDYYKEQKKLWRRQNPQKTRVYFNTYKNKNYGKVISWQANYRAKKLQATPKWFEKDLVEKVYEKAKIWGFEVDHVVPLNSEIVCGLHCWANLQLLTTSLNSSKKNKYWPDMP
jgi:hypothetical protein